MQGYLDEAAQLLRRFPPSKEYAAAEAIRPLAEALKWAYTAPAFSEDPLEAAYLNGLRLVQRGNYAAALDGLLDILRQDKRYRGDEIRRVVLALLETLGENNPLTSQYRRELAMVLF
jgi:putative thioredoxin